MDPTDEPILLSGQRHITAETQASQERESTTSMSRILTDKTLCLEHRVASPVEAIPVAIDNHQIPVRGQLRENGTAEMRPVVQSTSLHGSDTSYSGSVHSFNPLDYPNLLADFDLERSSQGISSNPGFIFNPLDYPSLLSPLPDPGIITPDTGFVFNPLNYPSIPSDPPNGNLESSVPPTTLSVF